MTGSDFQPGIACGATSHSMAPFVAPAGTSERATNQPLLCCARPSRSTISPPRTASIVMRWPLGLGRDYEPSCPRPSGASS